jgi:uncharacterized cupin superfamily protein
MRTFETGSTEFAQVGPVTVARWEQQYDIDGKLPFGAMWYTVPAGVASSRDCHPELELSIVVSGSATVEASGTLTEVSTGMAFLLDSEEAHIIHNRTDQPVTIFSAYWMPGDGSAEVADVAAVEAETAGV